MSVLNIRPLPSLEFLEEAFELDTENGFLFWKPRTPDRGFYSEKACRFFNTIFAGTRADRTTKARLYYTVKLRLYTGGKTHDYQAHRIIWKMVTGKDPVLLIDHIDRNKLNNRPSNLREADHMLNSGNRDWDAYRAKIKTRLEPGVYATKSGKFLSQAQKNGRSIHLGTFATREEASRAYREASQR